VVVRGRRREASGDVLDVRAVLGVEAVAYQRDRKGDRPDQEPGDGDAEGNAEVFGLRNER
jgi:hypothetical protein